jgi:iron complex outermembrane receptor protein
MSFNLTAFPAGPATMVVGLRGQPDTRSEGLTAYEAGHRYQANRRLWLDTSAFYNVYDHLSTVESGAPFLETSPPPVHFVAPLKFGNEMKGETYGAEVAGNYKVSDRLTLRTSYSFLRLALHGYDHAVASEDAEGHVPRHQAYVGAFLKLPRSFELSTHSYFVGRLRTFQLPAHTRLDMNVAWKKLENVEFSVAGQNLLGKHVEFGDFEGSVNTVNRTVYGKITWRF